MKTTGVKTNGATTTCRRGALAAILVIACLAPSQHVVEAQDAPAPGSEAESRTRPAPGGEAAADKATEKPADKATDRPADKATDTAPAETADDPDSLPGSEAEGLDLQDRSAYRTGLRRIRAELARIESERKKLIKTMPSLNVPTSGKARSPVLTRRRQVLALRLEEAVTLALENDLATRVAIEQARAGSTQYREARAVLDPVLTASVFRSRSRQTQIFTNPVTGQPLDPVLNQIDTWDFAAGISQFIPTGGQLSLDFRQSRRDVLGASNNPQISPSFQATLTQPLLRNRGIDVALAQLRNAELGDADAWSRLTTSYQQLILDVRRAYWAVVSAEENLRVQKANLTSGTEFLRGERAKLDYGKGRKLDVAIAEAEVARRAEAVIRAETELENVRDQLLVRISPSTRLLEWDVFIVPLERPVFVPPPKLDMGRALDTALQRRPDLKIAKRSILREERNLLVADNAVMPSLDFVMSGGVSAVGRKHHNAYRLLDPPEDAFNVRAGVQLRYPFFLRAERARRARARANLRAAELDLERLKSQVILELRRTQRQIISARERVIVNQRSLQLSERQLATEREAVKLGQSIPRNVLDAQQGLANARLALQSALIDYREAIAGYQSSLGILLDRYRSALPPRVVDALRDDVSLEDD